MVFFALFAVGDGDATGVFEVLGVGDGVGVGVGVGDSLATTEFVGVGDGLSDAIGAGVGNLSTSYVTFPSPFRTFIGKLSGSGVSDRCFITESTSGLKFGNTCDAPSAVIPARRVRISDNKLL